MDHPGSHEPDALGARQGRRWSGVAPGDGSASGRWCFLDDIAESSEPRASAGFGRNAKAPAVIFDRSPVRTRFLVGREVAQGRASNGRPRGTDLCGSSGFRRSASRFAGSCVPSAIGRHVLRFTARSDSDTGQKACDGCARPLPARHGSPIGGSEVRLERGAPGSTPSPGARDSQGTRLVGADRSRLPESELTGANWSRLPGVGSLRP